MAELGSTNINGDLKTTGDHSVGESQVVERDINAGGVINEQGERVYSPNNQNISSSVTSSQTDVYASVKGVKTAYDKGVNALNVANTKLGANSKAVDADKLDGINSSVFARKDQDIITGSTTISAGAGKVAITANDGKGNANVTFNHVRGIPMINGNAGRIEFNVDSTENPHFNFEMSANKTSGVMTDLTTVLTLGINQFDFRGQSVWHAGNDGAGSGLDSDKLDGQHGSFYAKASQVLTNVPAGAVFTDTQRAVSNSVSSTSATVAASSNAARIAYNKGLEALNAANGKLGLYSKAADSDKLDGFTAYDFARQYYWDAGSSNGVRRFIKLFTLAATDASITGIFGSGGDYGSPQRGSYQINAGTRSNVIAIHVYSLGHANLAEAPEFYTKKLSDGRFEVWAKMADYNQRQHFIRHTVYGSVTVHNKGTGTTTDPAGIKVEVKQIITDEDPDNFVKVNTKRWIGIRNVDGSDDVYIEQDDANEAVFGTSATATFKFVGDKGADRSLIRAGFGIFERSLDAKGGMFVGGNKVWHAGNDGSGSGLDADRLDGQHGSYYAQDGFLGGESGYKYWQRNYNVSATTILPILNRLGGALPLNGIYRFSAHISSTATNNGSVGVFWYENGEWKLNVSSLSGLGNNHPVFLVSGGVPSIKTSHANRYDVSIYHEMLFSSGGTDGNSNRAMIGADGYMSNKAGQLEYLGTHKVWHSGNDGSGSGLDADKLDGLNSSSYARLGLVNQPNNYLYIYRNTSASPLYITQGGSGDLARFMKGSAGTTESNTGVVMTNSGGVNASGAVKGSIFIVPNPTNSVATVTLGWDSNKPRLRVGGSGVGSTSSFSIQSTGDTNMIEVNVADAFIGSNKHKAWHAGNDGVLAKVNEVNSWSARQRFPSFEDGVTNLGKTATNLKTYTSNQWGGVLGQSEMIRLSSAGAPSSAGSYAYWTVLGKRDTAGGYSGLLMPYTLNNDLFVGSAGTATEAPRWSKVWTDRNDGAGSGLDADKLDGYQAADFLRKAMQKYDTQNGWLRETGDDDHVRVYGNSRTVVMRTDGTTQYQSNGAYPFIWLYGGDATANRLMLVSTDGDLWLKKQGNWISNLLNAKASASHNHDTVYLGKTAQAVDAKKLEGRALHTNPTGNTVPLRDGSGDINARLFRSNYQNQSTISGGMAFRTSTTDNYIRFCNSQSAIRNWLSVYSKAEVDALAGGSWTKLRDGADTSSYISSVSLAGKEICLVSTDNSSTDQINVVKGFIPPISGFTSDTNYYLPVGKDHAEYDYTTRELRTYGEYENHQIWYRTPASNDYPPMGTITHSRIY